MKNSSTYETASRIAVLIPCFNEAHSIVKVVQDFKAAVPQASIYIYDNNSTDATARLAGDAGAIVAIEPRQGKGNVIRRMFADVEADIYILVDGDDTYPAESAPALIEELLEKQLDMVVGIRLSEYGESAFPMGHRYGNALITGFVGLLFGRSFTDMLSGYRVFSRRFVKSFPALSSGFETETELTIHALELRMPIAEVQTAYGARPEGSESKLRTFRDGFRIVGTIAKLFKEERPLIFFSIIFLFLFMFSMILGYPIVSGFLENGLVPRLPTAVLATGIMLIAFLSLTCGLILDTVTRGRRELKRLAYLSIPPLNVGGRFTEMLKQTNSDPSLGDEVSKSSLVNPNS